MSTVAERIAALNAKKKADEVPSVVRSGTKWQKPTNVETAAPAPGAKVISPKGAISPQPTKAAPSWIKPVGASTSVSAPRVSGTLSTPITSPQTSPPSTPSLEQKIESVKSPVTKNVLPVLPISVKQPVEVKSVKLEQPAETETLKVEVPKIVDIPLAKEEVIAIEHNSSEAKSERNVLGDDSPKSDVEESERKIHPNDSIAIVVPVDEAKEEFVDVVAEREAIPVHETEHSKVSMLVDDLPVIVPVNNEPTREPEPSSSVFPPPIPPSRESLNNTETPQPQSVEESQELPKAEEQKSDIALTSIVVDESKNAEPVEEDREEKEVSPSSQLDSDSTSEHAPMLKDINTTSRRSVKFGQNDEVKVEEFDYHDLAPAEDEPQTPTIVDDTTRARRRSSIGQKVVSILKRASRGPSKAVGEDAPKNGISWG